MLLNNFNDIYLWDISIQNQQQRATGCQPTISLDAMLRAIHFCEFQHAELMDEGSTVKQLAM